MPVYRSNARRKALLSSLFPSNSGGGFPPRRPCPGTWGAPAGAAPPAAGPPPPPPPPPPLGGTGALPLGVPLGGFAVPLLPLGAALPPEVPPPLVSVVLAEACPRLA